MKAPCDELSIGSGSSGAAAAECAEKSGPWILAATILGSSMAFIDGTIVNVAAAKFQSAFHASVVDVQWVIEAYGLFLSALILAGGALGDWLGRRLVFLLGVGVFAAASAACGLAPSIEVLVIARSVQGIGAALLVPGSLAIISASFDEKSRGQAIGTWSGFTAITTALGPVLGGWLIEHASWRWAFFLNLPLAAVVVLVSLRHIPESRSSRAERLDWVGALLATTSLGAVVTGLLESSRLGWRNALVYGALIGGTALFGLFVWVERRVASPMVSFSLFKSRSFLGANLLTLLLYAAISIFFFLFPVTLMQVYRYSATVAGAASLPVILLMFFMSRWSGGLVRRYGGKIPLVAGPLLVAAGFVLFAWLSRGGSYWKTFFPALVVLGLGMAVTVAPLTTVVMSSVDRDHTGAASGINNAVSRLAGVLAIAVLGIVLLKSFTAHLERELAGLSLATDSMQEIRSKEIELAGMELPKELNAQSAAAARRAVDESFLAGFRLVLISCAGLAVGSAAMAWWLVPKK
ncbi:MAG TPA: MFS transporter [Candidatus Acidoferrum sp.]|jgi:EmrB/QacA subfamily drug resistance transporter